MDIEITEENILRIMNKLISVVEKKNKCLLFDQRGRERFKFLMQNKYVNMFKEVQYEHFFSPSDKLFYKGFEVMEKDYVLDNAILFTSTGGYITDEMIKQKHYEMSAE